MTWQKVIALLNNQYTDTFVRNFLKPCQLYERAPGSYILACKTGAGVEQVNLRARDNIKLYLATVVRSPVELDVINAERRIPVPTYDGPEAGHDGGGAA